MPTDLALLPNGSVLSVMRFDSGDGENCKGCSAGCRGPCRPYHRSLSTDRGRTWSRPTPLYTTDKLPMGCARPRLLQLSSGPLLLTGGRTCARNGAQCDTAATPSVLTGREAQTVLCPAGCGGGDVAVYGSGPFALESSVCVDLNHLTRPSLAA